MTKNQFKNIDHNYIKNNYISYHECLQCLFIARPTLQQHMREGKLFTEKGDTIILPNKKRVFHKNAVAREIAKIIQNN